MEPRRSSNKTRSYGGAPKATRNSQHAPATGTAGPGGRSPPKERVRSAPLGISRSGEPQQHKSFQQLSIEGLKTEEESSDTGPRSPSLSPSPTKQQTSPTERNTGLSQVTHTKTWFYKTCANCKTRSETLAKFKKLC